MANINPNEITVQSFLAEGGSVIQNAIGLDGHTINTWTMSQIGSGGRAYAFTLIPFAGPGSPATYYAAVWVAKNAGPPAFPALAFSPLNGDGHFVQIDEVTGAFASSQTPGNFGVNVSGNFYQIWVKFPDTSTSIEFQVELYPSGLGVFDGFPSAGQQTESAAVFTVRDVSIGAHP
jgi:hypothetical protein